MDIVRRYACKALDLFGRKRVDWQRRRSTRVGALLCRTVVIASAHGIDVLDAWRKERDLYSGVVVDLALNELCLALFDAKDTQAELGDVIECIAQLNASDRYRIFNAAAEEARKHGY